MQNLMNAWRYESVRLLETVKGELRDDAANQFASRSGSDPSQQLMARASQLANTEGIGLAIENARRWSVRLVIVLWLMSFVLGVSTGLAVLGDSARPVNVLWAIGSLLLVPCLTLMLWVLMISFGSGTGGWLGHWAQWLIGRTLNKGLDSTVWRAWLHLSDRTGTERWWLSLMTHAIWFWMMVGMLIAALFAFSFQHYTFVWQTTWLSPELFVGTVQALGKLPALIGFTVPDVTMIESSGNLALDEPAVRSAWANWLVGTVLVFGCLPRLIAGLLSYVVIRHRYRSSPIGLKDAYALSVLDRMNRDQRRPKADQPKGPADDLGTLKGLAPEQAMSHAVLLAIESDLPTDLMQSPSGATAVLPNVDDNESRRVVLAKLDHLKPAKLLLVVDARLTPDRGSLRVIRSMGERAVQTRVLLGHADDVRARVGAWRTKLLAMQVESPMVAVNEAANWLEQA